MAIHRKNQDLINIGAYPAGTNPAIDLSIHLNEPLKNFLRQAVDQGFGINQSWQMLKDTMAAPLPAKPAAFKKNP
jgi:flagellum-specific ATP synthase